MSSTSHSLPHQDAPGWGAVDEGLQRLEGLAAAQLSATEFYTEFCQQLLDWGLDGVAIWSSAAGLKLEREQAGENLPLATISQQSAVQLQEQLGSAISRGDRYCIRKSSAEGWQTIVVPWQQDNVVAGLLQVFLPTNIHATALDGYAQLASTVAELLALFHSHHGRREWKEKYLDLQRQQNLLGTIASTLDLKQAAYHLAHDGRTVLQCDRLSVVARQGTKYQTLAVSGAEFVHRRAEVVTAMQRLCTAIAATGEELWTEQPAAELPPQLAEAVADYLEISPARELGVIPFLQFSTSNEESPDDEKSKSSAAAPMPPFALVVIEQFSAEQPTRLRQRSALLVNSTRPALQQVWQLQSVPFKSLWTNWQRSAARWWWLSRGAIVVAVSALIVALLFLIPAEVQLRAPGELQPTIRHEVFAPEDSIVADVFVDHGDDVTAQMPLLQLTSVDLDLESQQVAGELETVRKQLAAVLSERLQAVPGDAESRLRQRKLTADEAQYQEQIKGLVARQDLLKKRQAELRITSPAAGSVITWNARERLQQRPLRRGDQLLTIADETGPWQAELRLPARQASRLLTALKSSAPIDESAALPVSIALSTAPGVLVEGKLRSVAERMEVDQSGTSYLPITVELPAEALPQTTVGAVVNGKVQIGRSSLFVAWFHEAIDAARYWCTW